MFAKTNLYLKSVMGKGIVGNATDKKATQKFFQILVLLTTTISTTFRLTLFAFTWVDGKVQTLFMRYEVLWTVVGGTRQRIWLRHSTIICK
jgi:hypothetical protein